MDAASTGIPSGSGFAPSAGGRRTPRRARKLQKCANRAIALRTENVSIYESVF